MPKIAAYTLAWSSSHHAYELYEGRTDVSVGIRLESPAWLAQVSSFAFRGKTGSYTARKERSQSDEYWYAYRHIEGKLTKRYLGRSRELTGARLEHIAEALTAASQQGSGRPREQEAISHQFLIVPADIAEELVSPSHAPLPSDLLVATKLHMPRPRTHLVSRSHLVERLQQAVERALTLVSAPAGFGKTTLLAQWLEESGMPAAWLSLEAEDNDPTRFLSYVIAALQTLDAQIGTYEKLFYEQQLVRNRSPHYICR